MVLTALLRGKATHSKPHTLKVHRSIPFGLHAPPPTPSLLQVQGMEQDRMPWECLMPPGDPSSAPLHCPTPGDAGQLSSTIVGVV